MKYKKIERMGISPSLLGFGCMRFPTIQNENGENVIDFDQTKEMIEYAISHGLTYIDTAYPYHNGESERVVGRILKNHDRSSFTLATKLPLSRPLKKEEVREIFYEQLAKLQMDYVDFYLLHAMNAKRLENVLEIGAIEILDELKKEGKIRYLGFSFHDSYDVFGKIINLYDWDFCQIQFNYMDTDIQAGMKGLKLAESKGIPVTVMEPLKGGYLSNLSDDVVKLFKDYNKDASVSSWGLRYVGSQSGVKVVLSGMSSLDQVKDNISVFEDFRELNEEEYEIIRKARELIESKVMNSCTGCRYCMPCPQGIDIPWNFSYWNNMAKYNNPRLVDWYVNNPNDEIKAKNCIGCGRCEKLCPQGISIRSDLKSLDAYFKNKRKEFDI